MQAPRQTYSVNEDGWLEESVGFSAFERSLQAGRHSVDAPEWTDLPGGDVTATGTQASAFDPATAGVEQRYYRVLLVTP